MAFLQSSGTDTFWYLDRHIGGGSEENLKVWVYITVDDYATVAAASYFAGLTGPKPIPGDTIRVFQCTDRRDLGTCSNAYDMAVVDFDGAEFIRDQDGNDGADGVSSGVTWNFDSSTTTAADPGTGDIRLNNAAFASVTEVSISDLCGETGNPDASAWVLTFDDSTSTVKGHLLLKRRGAEQNFALFSVSALSDQAGYTQVTVSHLASNGSFSNGDPLALQFCRTGDKGASGTGSGDLLAAQNLNDVADKPTAFANIKQAASASATGVVELATTTEALTGTDTARAVTPDALAALWEKGSDVASAGTVSLGEGGFFHITGTTTITDIDFATAKDGRWAWVIFDGALTLTHNATTLVLPGGANIVTAAGDRALFVQDNSDNVYCVAYFKAAIVPGGDASLTVKGVVEMATAAEYRAATATVPLSLSPKEAWDAAAEVTLTDGASIAVDWSTGINFTVTLGGNRALANGSNEKAGQSGVIRVVQDATGNRTLSFGTDYEFAGGTAVVLSTAANAQDLLFYYIISSTRVFISAAKAIA